MITKQRKEAKMIINNFKINTGDQNSGTIYRPDSIKNNIPMIIYCHWWGGNRTLNPSTNKLCEKAVELGIGMITFDFFGCGETGGDYSQMTYGRWKENLSNIFSWVLNQEWVDKEKVGCFCISSGTIAALRFAQEDERIAFIISIATCLSLNIIMPNGPGKLFIDNFDLLMDNGTVNFAGIEFGIDFYKDCIGKAPIYRLSELKCPVFFLQGQLDNIYRRTDAWIGFEIMKKNNLPVKYMELDGGDHGLDSVPERCAAESIKWLKEIGII
jgi:acetyl esterase/lipase